MVITMLFKDASALQAKAAVAGSEESVPVDLTKLGMAYHFVEQQQSHHFHRIDLIGEPSQFQPLIDKASLAFTVREDGTPNPLRAMQNDFGGRCCSDVIKDLRSVPFVAYPIRLG